jgi:myosin heavy subunit
LKRDRNLFIDIVLLNVGDNSKMKYINWFMLMAILVVTGCGVPQEEHDAAVAQLQAERAEVESTLSGKISDLESVVKSEKAKGKSIRLQLESSERKLRESQKKAISAAKDAAKVKAQVTSLERDVSRAESASDRVQDQLSAVQEQLTSSESERDELQRRLDMLMNNMSGLSNTGSFPTPGASDMMDAGAEAMILSGDNADLEFLPASEKARVLLERMKAK